MSSHSFLQRARRVVLAVLIFGLALVALTLFTGLQPHTLAQPVRTPRAATSLITQTYVIVATGPKAGGSVSVFAEPTIFAPNPPPFTVLGGGIYAGDSASLLIVVNGAPPPPVDVVGGCPNCITVGNAVTNYDAVPLSIPILYNVADFQPGGVYANIAGANYHYYTSSQFFSGSLPSGLDFVNGNVTLENITSTVSIVATGQIDLIGRLTLTTYDSRFPLLFSLSSNTGNGAILGRGNLLDFAGDVYAPNGLITLWNASGPIHGRIYGRNVYLGSWYLSITCPACDFAPTALDLTKAVTPTVNVPYHGVVTYTSILTNYGTATNVLFTDTLPTGVTFGQWIDQPDGIIQNGNSITWTGNISPSTAITFTFTATHTGSYGDVITNTAYFSDATYAGSASATFAVTNPQTLRTYLIAATGPSSTGTSVHLSGSSGAGGLVLQILGGGIYGGDGGYIQNVYINGTPPPMVDMVGGCIGTCSFTGNAVANYNAAPMNIPPLYNFADFLPGGVYAIAAGSNYHAYTSSQSFAGYMTGLYFVDGDVYLHDVGSPLNLQSVSIVATGDIHIIGSLFATSYDPRFPLLFTTSNNISYGAISAHNPVLVSMGDLYAPNGVISINGAAGVHRGRVYAQDVSWDASLATIACPGCDLSGLTLSLQKSVTPTVDVPYHGVVTYTSVLHSHDLVSDTDALFTDTLPAGVTFGQWLEQPAGVVQNGASITWTGTILAASAIAFTFTATHTGNYSEVITNTAYFSSATSTGSASATLAVIPAYTLALTYMGNGTGIVAVDPIGPDYPAGTIVTLTAVPSPTSQFTGWSGDVISTTNPLLVTMDGDKIITVHFITHRVYLPLILK